MLDSEAARRRRFGTLDVEVPASAAGCSLADRELAAILDQELSRLPSKYRSPLVLCYLEGQTHEQAAEQLRWPIGTVKGRLALVRDLLRSRLVRRGLAPTAGALLLALGRETSASLHPQLLDRTVQASLQTALGQAASQVMSSSITSLVEGVLTAMIVTKLKWIGLIVLVSGLALTSAGVMARQNTRKSELPSQSEGAEKRQRRSDRHDPRKGNPFGENLPSARFRQKDQGLNRQGQPFGAERSLPRATPGGASRLSGNLGIVRGWASVRISGLSSFATLDGCAKRESDHDG